MKQVTYDEQAALLLRDIISELVEKNYFSEEDYAVTYIREMVMFFQWNMNSLVSHDAPEYFNRFSVHHTPLKYVSFRKSARTTWYAFYEEDETSKTIVYVANNHLIGHKLGIDL